MPSDSRTTIPQVQTADDQYLAHGRTFPKCSRGAIHGRIVEILRDEPRGKLLDAPAGSGRLSWWLHREGFDVVAGDIAPEAFRNPEIPIHQVDLNERFPFDDDTFDYACFVEGPEHVENAFSAMREYARVLRPGGRLVVSIPNYSNLEARIKELLYGTSERLVDRAFLRDRLGGFGGNSHINRLSYPMLRMTMEFAGLQVERIPAGRRKAKQLLLWPLAGLIMGVSALRGENGRRKYWLHETNSPAVLMGGNTLIVVARKDGTE